MGKHIFGMLAPLCYLASVFILMIMTFKLAFGIEVKSYPWFIGLYTAQLIMGVLAKKFSGWD